MTERYLRRIGIVLVLAGLALFLFATFCMSAHADDFDDHLAQLKAQNAAAKPHDHADPFAAKNAAYTHRYESDYGGRYVCDCGCIETGQCVCKNCCSPAKTRRADERPAAKGGTGFTHCDCAGPGDCSCPNGGPGGGSCLCANCSAAPKLGDRKVTDDPSRPFVYGWGDAYGYGHELGWYRYAAPVVPPVFYAPPRQAFFAPAFGGGGFSCGPSG